MSPGITLLLAPLHRDGVDHIVHAPRWAPPNDADGYWHIPRSISAEDGGEIGRVLFWCGVERTTMRLRALTNREPQSNRCGTCVGRASGYERQDGIIFQPRSAFDPPRVCPAMVGDNETCRVCDSKPRHRRSYCHYDEVPHRPGPGLAQYEPCPRHGWKNLAEERIRHADANGFLTRRETGRIVCNSNPTYYDRQSDCGFVLFSASAAYLAAWDAAIQVQSRRRAFDALMRRERTRPRLTVGRQRLVMDLDEPTASPVAKASLEDSASPGEP